MMIINGLDWVLQESHEAFRKWFEFFPRKKTILMILQFIDGAVFRRKC